MVSKDSGVHYFEEGVFFMKAASERLKRLLIESHTFYIADLYKITLTDGMVLRYTSADIALIVGDERYTPLAIERDGTTQTNDISVDEMHLTITVDPSERLDRETTILQAIVAGRFADAELELYRLFSPEPFTIFMECIDSDYALLWWLGRLNIESAGGITIEATVASMTELLNVKFPTHLYYPPCIYTLGDQSCSVNLDKFRQKGTSTGGTRSVIQSELTLGNGYLAQGSITFTAGRNAGVTRTIRTDTAGDISVVMPFYYPPAVGDTFCVLPACDKSMKCCKERFNNLKRFRGYPFIPVPETAH